MFYGIVSLNNFLEQIETFIQKEHERKRNIIFVHQINRPFITYIFFY